MSSRLLGINAF